MTGNAGAAGGDPTAASAAHALDAHHPGGRLGLAVSGGGDSVALMLLAAEWARARGASLAVATVDHGLRQGSQREAAWVVSAAAASGLPATVLRWEGWSGSGGVQACAREARTRLLAGWARRESLGAVALGHTLDDQAETVLMRLLRGGGVDALAGMAPSSRREGTLWLRPLLGLSRRALREWLAGRGAAWIEDPSNEDPRFERVAIRQTLAALGVHGLDASRLGETAARMRAARDALDQGADALWRAAVAQGACGEARIARAALAGAPEEIALRLLRRALRLVAPAQGAAPRRAALGEVLAAARRGALGRGRTLAGCILLDEPDDVVVAREPAAAAAADPADHPWDGRWRLQRSGDGEPRALGAAGERALAAARRAGAWEPPPCWSVAPRPARLAAPALWHGETLLCVPAAGYGEGLAARAMPVDAGGPDFERPR